MWASVFDEHQDYLEDRRRLDAYAAALNEVINEGDIVVDLGAGTGVLGILAVKAGAARVYALEGTRFAALTRQLIESNGMADRIVCIRSDSRLVELPSRADVVVGDQLDGFVVDADLLETYADAARHLLAPGGTLIPSDVTWHAVPVEMADVHRRRKFWDGCRSPIDVAVAGSLFANARRYGQVTADQVLAPSVASAPLSLASVPAEVKFGGQVVVQRDGRIDALAGFLTAQLSKTVSLTTDPRASDRINRSLSLLPLGTAIEVAAGDELAIHVHVRPGSGHISWRVAHASEVCAGNSFLGEIIGAEDLDRLQPSYRPTLNMAGQLRLRAYELCDGTHSRAEIEQKLRDEHPRQFPTAAALAAFV